MLSEGSMPGQHDTRLSDADSCLEVGGDISTSHIHPTNIKPRAPPVFSPGDMVVAIVPCGGDESTRTPAFAVGDVMRVVLMHEGGWLEVEGGYISPAWVKKAASPVKRPQFHPPPPPPNIAKLAPPPADVVTVSVLRTGDQKLGLQLVGGRETQAQQVRPGIFVKQIFDEGQAAATGGFVAGDQILSVNGVDFSTLLHAEAISIVTKPGTLVFVLRRADAGAPRKEPTKKKKKAATPAVDSETSSSSASSSSDDDDDEIAGGLQPASADPLPQEASGDAANPLARRMSAAKDALKLLHRYSGWLSKQAGGKLKADGSAVPSRKNWKRRWVELQETVLKYFPDEPKAGETALGYLNLDAESTVQVLSEKAFVVSTRVRMFYLTAATAVDARAWVDVLRAVIQQAQAM